MESPRPIDDRHIRAAFEAAPVGLLLVDGEGRIVAANREIESQFGYFRSELIGQEVEILLPEGARAGHVGLRRSYLAHPAPRSMGAGRELFGRRRDGSLFPIEIGLTPSGSEAGGLVIAAIADVRTRKELQERARRSERLSALGELTGAVAHDFNNLLTAIMAPLDLSLGLLAESGEAAPLLLQEIKVARGSAERAASLTRHLLAFSRRRVFSPVPLQLNSVIEGSRPMLERLLSPAKLRFRLRPDLPAVLLDPGLFDQVLLNLAVNAGDATNRKGSIEFRTSTIPDQEGLALRVVLEVIDDGVGMREETVAHIFEPFFTTKQKGTGLGLATVHGIVTQAGGSIRVTSELGSGITFELTFPSTSDLPVREPVRPPNGPTRTAGNGEWILVVEDQDELRTVAGRALGRFGYRVHEAQDGGRAIEIFRETHTSLGLVVADIGLPDMDGLDLADRLLAVDASVPIAFTSGHSEEDLIQRFAKRGPQEFLEKPYSLNDLVAMVHRTVRVTPPQA